MFEKHSCVPNETQTDSFHRFKLFRASFEKTREHTILSVTSDNGGEYISTPFQDYLLANGINRVPGPPHTPQLNGVAERANRTIGDLIRCSLISASLPKAFWVDALRHSFHAYNTYPCVTPQGFQSPNSILGCADVDLGSLHPLGCLVWYTLPEANQQKLDPKERSSLLLPYLPDGKEYRLWDLQRCVFIKSRDVIFEDTRFPYNEPLKSPPEPVLFKLVGLLDLLSLFSLFPMPLFLHPLLLVFLLLFVLLLLLYPFSTFNLSPDLIAG